MNEFNSSSRNWPSQDQTTVSKQVTTDEWATEFKNINPGQSLGKEFLQFQNLREDGSLGSPELHEFLNPEIED